MRCCWSSCVFHTKMRTNTHVHWWKKDDDSSSNNSKRMVPLSLCYRERMCVCVRSTSPTILQREDNGLASIHLRDLAIKRSWLCVKCNPFHFQHKQIILSLSYSLTYSVFFSVGSWKLDSVPRIWYKIPVVRLNLFASLFCHLFY